MSWFDVTFVLLKEKVDPLPFLVDFHKELAAINVVIDKSDQEFITFNDTKAGEEKEIVELNESMTIEEIIRQLCSWKALGLICYRHPDFKFPVSIHYLTWDERSLEGFTIGFNGKDHIHDLEHHKQDKLIGEISSLVNYKLVVGDVGPDSETFVNLEQDLPVVIDEIANGTFRVEIRN